MSKYLKEENFRKNRYFIYARKSSESEDKQVESIPSQIKVMTELARELGLNVVGTFHEASSGFHTGRKVFNEMLSQIENDEADGIIAWKLSRLSRNPDDAGRIMGLLQRTAIKHIRTIERNWLPADNVLLMYVEFGLTNQFSRDLSQDTNRGLIEKAERGWSPKSHMPLGYMHNPLKVVDGNEILIDPDRFNFVSDILKKVASGEFRPKQALKYANQIGLRTRSTKRFRSKEVGESVFYRMLADPFYYGKFEFPEGSGNWYEGKHEKAITKKEFDLIQNYRNKKSSPRPQKHLFPFTGFIKCGECGCSIVVDPKVKVQKNGNRHEYLYYRCTKSKKDCSQKYLERNKLEKQIADILGEIQISNSFHDWAMEELKMDLNKDIKDREQILSIAQKGYTDSLEHINNLVREYIAKKIPEESYNQILSEFTMEKDKFKNILDNVDDNIQDWTDKAKTVFNFARDAKEMFENGNVKTKTNILRSIGANITIKDLKISIDIQEPLIVIKNSKEMFNKIREELEPQKRMNVNEKVVFSASKNIRWGD